jgi:hypothetical protein
MAEVMIRTIPKNMKRLPRKMGRRSKFKTG